MSGSEFWKKDVEASRKAFAMSGASDEYVCMQLVNNITILYTMDQELGMAHFDGDTYALLVTMVAAGEHISGTDARPEEVTVVVTAYAMLDAMFADFYQGKSTVLGAHEVANMAAFRLQYFPEGFVGAL